MYDQLHLLFQFRHLVEKALRGTNAIFLSFLWELWRASITSMSLMLHNGALQFLVTFSATFSLTPKSNSK